MTVISTRWWSTPVTQKKERKSHVPLASYGRRLHGRRHMFISPHMGLMMIKPVSPKRAEVACSVGQLWEEIAWVKKHVHISVWEFDSNIRSTVLNGKQWNSTVHSSLSRCYPVCTFSAIVKLTLKCPGLIDERFEYLSWLLQLHTSIRQKNKCIFLYILRVVICLARSKRNTRNSRWHALCEQRVWWCVSAFCMVYNSSMRVSLLTRTAMIFPLFLLMSSLLFTGVEIRSIHAFTQSECKQTHPRFVLC